MKKKNYLLIIIAGMIFLGSCKPTTKKTSSETEVTALAPAPIFSEDSAYTYIKEQCDFGPRVPNTQAHRACGEYIAAKFQKFGAEITNQYVDIKAYNGDILKSRNIIASFNPESKKRILICAHWDSRPWCDNDPDSANWRKPVMGANDAASGVGVMLELARLIQSSPIESGIDFICFDAEDYGTPQWEAADKDNSNTWCLGSQYWAGTPHVYGYRARFGILLDMVGGQGTQFYQEQISKHYAPQIVEMVWNTASQLGFGHYFPKEEGAPVTDDHIPVNQIAHIPCIDILPYFKTGPSSFGPTWHTINDNVDHIDKNVLKAVGQTVLQVIYNEK